MSDRVLALIPARGGSKGIPRKNVMEIAGRPLIAWSIVQALESERITRVVVSTDDPEIASVAEAWGAEVPFLRPADYAQDLSPDIDAFRHALRFLAENESYEPDVVVHLRPSGPVRVVADIDAAIDVLTARPEADAVRSVSPALLSPFKMWRIREDGFMEPLLRLPGISDCQSLPRQSLPDVHWQNGHVDVLRPRAVLEKDSMWGERVLPFVVEQQMLELDYADDIAAVEEALIRLQQGRGPASAAPRRHPV